MISRCIAISATASLMAGCSAYDNSPGPAASAEAERDCFYLSQVSGYTPGDGRDKINVNVGPGRTYEFETFGSCPDLDYSEAIGFDKKGPGTICRGMDVDLIVPSSVGPHRCPVSMIRRLPREAEE